MPDRRLRVLFFVREAPYVRRVYASLIAELIDRGHEVELAFSERTSVEHAKAAIAGFTRPGVTASVAPRRDRTDSWRSVAWLVRALGDLARYSDPRYEGATRLRRRVTEKVVDRLEEGDGFEPLGLAVARRLARRLASTTDAELSAKVVAATSELEESIPASARIDGFIRERSPDVVLVTPVVKYGSDEVDYLKSARNLGIPSASCVASWDNLTNKGLLKLAPERVFVWNEIQRREAIDQHAIPADRVVATGAQLFDKWFEQRPSRSREAFLGQVGLDPAAPYVLYVCSSPFVVDRSDAEARFVTAWVEALRASDDERLRRLGVMVRPHPRGKPWKGSGSGARGSGSHRLELGRFENAVVWPSKSAPADTPDALADFYDSLAHAGAVVGINTTAMIEAAIVGKSVLTVLEPAFAQESTLHFRYLLEENGGLLHVASSLEDHLSQLARVLDEDQAGARKRRRFVESFVRPHGLERPATPILADAVEELARLPLAAPLGQASWLLRSALGVEAALASLALGLGRKLRYVRGLRAVLVGAVRRRGFLLLRSD